MGTKRWILVAVGVAGLLGVVFGFPLTHSPRYETLNPILWRTSSLPEFKELAVQHGLPHEVSVAGEGTVVTFPLDGSKTGKSLLVRFNRWGGLTGASIKDWFGKESECFWVERR